MPRLACATHEMAYPHSLHRRSPDARRVPFRTRHLPCRPIPAAVAILGA